MRHRSNSAHGNTSAAKLLIALCASLLIACFALATPNQQNNPFATSELGLAIVSDSAHHAPPAPDALLSAPWPDPLQFTHDRNLEAPGNVHDCDGLLHALKHHPDLQPANAADRPAFLFRTNTCLAVQALAEAKPSKLSHVRSFRLGANALGLLPADLAFAISQQDAERLENYRGESLETVYGNEPDLAFEVDEVVSPYRIRLSDTDGGRQEISILGYGDFDDDGLEDLLLMVQNTIDGASYYASDLYQLTSKGGRPLEVLHVYKLPKSER